MKLGFSLQENYALPMPQVVDLLADAGFCALSPGWQRDVPLNETIQRARQRNMTIQSLHGPLRGMRAMWDPDLDIAQPILKDILQSAADCAAFCIPILVVHPWNGVNDPFPEKNLCFDHFDTLVSAAERHHICVAFENLEGPEFLSALMERYAQTSAVGFCWDSGHELCYAPGWDFLSHFGDRLVMTHLNDNLGVTDPSGLLQGTDDLHLLPGHGIVDWAQTLSRLKAARPQEILNFELKIRPKGNRCKLDLYSHLPLNNYFQEAYARAAQVLNGYFDKKA